MNVQELPDFEFFDHKRAASRKASGALNSGRVATSGWYTRIFSSLLTSPP